MTPLAQAFAKQLTLPLRDRTHSDFADVVHRMDDVHCFEVTDILPLINDALKSRYWDLFDFWFLPAPKTWIECKFEFGRLGFLVETEGESSIAKITYCLEKDGSPASSDAVLYLDLIDPAEPFAVSREWEEQFGLRSGSFFCSFVATALALINTPRIIGRRTHAPHRGLERKLLAQQKVIGKFPLHAWTEIILEVHPPIEAINELGVEAHLTGRRALHFVRAHLRIRDGQLIFVSAHWRGDASLGIKQSRHKLVPPRDGSRPPSRKRALTPAA